MNAKRDENFIPTMTALEDDGETVSLLKANPATHALRAVDGSSGADHGPANAGRDGNDVSTLLAVSEDDGVTPVALYTDQWGNLLIDSM